MTMLYRPVLIESAEQAEVLPIGAIVRRGKLRPLELWHDTYTGELSWGDEDLDLEDLVGFTALVPIEAEEEFTAMGTDDGEHWIAHVGPDGITGSREDAEQYTKRFGGFIARRYRTPWEEA